MAPYFEAGADVRGVHIDDFDEDGLPDLLFVVPETGSIQVQLGKNNFDMPQSFLSTNGTFSASIAWQGEVVGKSPVVWDVSNGNKLV